MNRPIVIAQANVSRLLLFFLGFYIFIGITKIIIRFACCLAKCLVPMFVIFDFYFVWFRFPISIRVHLLFLCKAASVLYKNSIFIWFDLNFSGTFSNDFVRPNRGNKDTSPRFKQIWRSSGEMTDKFVFFLYLILLNIKWKYVFLNELSL